MRVLDPDGSALDPLDAIGSVAELKDVARHALDGEILVDGADDMVLRLQHHLVVGGVGNCAAGGQRGRSRAAPAAQHAIDGVVMDERAAPATARREAFRQHADDGVEILALSTCGTATRAAAGRRAPASGQSCAETSATICWASTSSGWSGIVRRSSSPRRTLSSRAAHSTRSSRESGNRRPLGVPPTAWPERPTRCRKRGDRAGRAELADQVHVADIDAELERGGRDQGLQFAVLQPLLGREPLLLRHAAVMGGDRVLAEPLRQLAGDALRHASRIDEHQRGAVLFDEPRQAIVDLLPDVARHHRLERRIREPRGRGRAGADGRCRRSPAQRPARRPKRRRPGDARPR